MNLPEIQEGDEGDEITLPWRSFKAFVQLFDHTKGGLHFVEVSKSPKGPIDLLVQSPTRAGDRTRASLLSHDLIEICEGNHVGIKRGLPHGREHLVDDPILAPIVMPEARSEAGIAWRHTKGRCAYCGLSLSFFYQFVVGSNTANGVHLAACKKCHSSRGSKSLEDYRFEVQMDRFEVEQGIRFDRGQVEYLKSELGVELDLPGYEFWFEACATVNRGGM